ncbi:hypothetical protein HOF92_15465 [bacterium]|jgi:hypothetical protein|nr:hypothetical protein [bacterium]
MPDVEIDVQELADKLERLSSEILLTVQDGLQFIALLEEYQSKFHSIQNNLLKLRERIQDGEFSDEIEAELQRNLRAMNQLMGPKIRNFIQNRFELFQNFESSARKQSEELTWKALKARMGQINNLLH